METFLLTDNYLQQFLPEPSRRETNSRPHRWRFVYPIVFLNSLLIYRTTAIVQTMNESFDFNGESDLDLEVRTIKRI